MRVCTSGNVWACVVEGKECNTFPEAMIKSHREDNELLSSGRLVRTGWASVHNQSMSVFACLSFPRQAVQSVCSVIWISCLTQRSFTQFDFKILASQGSMDLSVKKTDCWLLWGGGIKKKNTPSNDERFCTSRCLLHVTAFSLADDWHPSAFLSSLILSFRSPQVCWPYVV